MSGPLLYKKIQQFLFKNKTRTYIVPTSFGFAFAVLGLVLFALAVGAANNLAYIFIFFLISVALTSMSITNKNVDGLIISEPTGGIIFAEEPCNLGVLIQNKNATCVRDLEIYGKGYDQKLILNELDSGLEVSILVPWTAPRRGLINSPIFISQSDYPFGLLRAWKVFEFPKKFFVFPARKGDPTFPPLSVVSQENKNGGLFKDHRFYTSSDPLSRIDWKASARRQSHLIKTFEESENHSLYFCWEQTSHLNDFEARVSQLALWLDKAEKSGLLYSVKINDHQTLFESGKSHYLKCLEFLALMNPGDQG